jgi:hypothetical protein
MIQTNGNTVNERSSKVTVVLYRRQVARLDRLASTIRLKSRVTLSRRAMIEAMTEAFSRRDQDETIDMLAAAVRVSVDRASQMLATPQAASPARPARRRVAR